MTARPPAVLEPRAIAERARAAGILLTAEAAQSLAAHAREVLAANERLHLTAITQPEDFLERHLGEAFEGAALVPEETQGVLVDLGSGNGYPGIPLALSRPGLQLVLAEASSKKAAFLREALIAAKLDRGRVLEAHVARTVDLADVPPVSVLTTRAMGGWERIVPKLISRLAPEGIVLVWAGSDLSALLARATWARLRVVTKRRLPGRDRSSVYLLRLHK